eukprot:768805-Hanusia_phi.AAC.4
MKTYFMLNAVQATQESEDSITRLDGKQGLCVCWCQQRIICSPDDWKPSQSPRHYCQTPQAPSAPGIAKKTLRGRSGTKRSTIGRR